MTKQDIINTLNEICISHSEWGFQEKVIVGGINFDQLIAPDNYLESELYRWLNVNKNNLLAFSWYVDLKESHAKLHHCYSSLFYASTRKYNPKTREQLTEDFKLFENILLDFKNKMLEIDKEVTELSSEEFLDIKLKSNADFRKLTSENALSDDLSHSLTEDPLEEKTKSAVFITTPIQYQHYGVDKDNNNDSLDDVFTTLDIHDKPKKDDTFAELDESNSLDELELSTHENPIVESELESKVSPKLQKIDINEFVKEESLDSKTHTSNIIESELIDNDQIIDAAEVERANTSSEIVRILKGSEEVKRNSTNSNLVDKELAEKNNADEVSEELKEDTSAFSASASNVELNEISVFENISLRQQNILQLNQEKDFIKLEMRHLDEKEKLTQSNIDQLEEHLITKKEQVEVEQSANKKLIEKNTDVINQIEEKLLAIEESRLTIQNEVNDLEEANTDDKIKSKDAQQTTLIEKQFSALKLNKNRDLSKLEDHLQLRKQEMIQLQSELLSLEEDISEMEAKVKNKKNDLDALIEKEQLKNVERISNLNTQKDEIDQRDKTIKEKQETLNKMNDEIALTQNEINKLNVINTELNKEIEIVSNNNEINNLEQQKNIKIKNLTDTELLKSEKQNEINNIQGNLKAEKKALGKLYSQSKKNNVDLEEKGLETAE